MKRLMAKVKVCTVALAICGLSFLSSCKRELLENCALKRNEKYELTSTRQKLLDYAVTGNYKIDEEQIQKDVLIAFNSMNNNSSTARSVGQEVMLSKIQSEKYEVPQQLKAARSAAVESYEDIDFSVYEINSGNGKSFAITSNDRRIGEIIAIADGEFETDISENPFMQIVAAGLENHVNRTIKEWNSLSDEEVTSARASISPNTDIAEHPTYYKFNKAVYKTGMEKPLCRTEWDQESPYNKAVKDVLNSKGKVEKTNDIYVTGCGPTALAQICAYYKFPEKCESNALEDLKKHYKPAKNWDGIYDYHDMIYVDQENEFRPRISDLSSNGKMNVNALMYDIGINSYAKYYKDDEATVQIERRTSLSNENARQWLISNGFSCDEITDYDFNKIKESLDKKSPVYISGMAGKNVVTYRETEKFLWWTVKERIYTQDEYSNSEKAKGHAWIIDAYGTFECTYNYKKKKVSETITITDDYVRCNYGWGGANNGFYLNGLFFSPSFDITYYNYTEENPVEYRAITTTIVDIKEVGTPGYYKYFLKIIPNISYRK